MWGWRTSQTFPPSWSQSPGSADFGPTRGYEVTAVMAKPKVDWSRLCSEYVTASQPVTLTDLANAYGIARETVSRKATKEQWDVKRERYLMRVEEQTTEKKAEKVARAGADFDTAMLKRIDDLLAEFDREKPQRDPKAARAWADVFKALTSAQSVEKAALGDKPNGDLSLTVSVREYVESES